MWRPQSPRMSAGREQTAHRPRAPLEPLVQFFDPIGAPRSTNPLRIAVENGMAGRAQGISQAVATCLRATAHGRAPNRWALGWSTRRALQLCMVAAVAFSAEACVGNMGDASPSGALGPGPQNGPASSAPPPGPTVPSVPSPSEGFPPTDAMFPPTEFEPLKNRLYRLTRPQIVGTLNAALGTQLERDALGLDPVAFNFRTNATMLLSDTQLLLDISALIDQGLRLSSQQVRTFLQCDASLPLDCNGPECRCLDDYLTRLTLLAFRRPITDAERMDYHGLLQRVGPAGDPETIKTLVHAVFTDQAFLFRSEVDLDHQSERFAQQALANIHLLVTNRPPSPELLNQAASLLATEGAFASWVDELLSTSDATDMLETFIAQWLQVENMNSVTKNEQLFPAFTDELVRSMETEMKDFIAYIARRDAGHLTDLLTSRHSTIDATLASFYGEAAGDMWVSDRRKGVLTKGAFLAKNAGDLATIPTSRGAVLLSNLLCYKPPEVPSGLTLGNELPPNLTTRQKFELHASEPACRACHQVMDPLGFALENYDAIGAFRTREAGAPIDPAAELTVLPFTSDMSFDGPAEMIDQLAAAPELRSCLVRQVFRYVQGDVERPADHTVLAQAMDDFRASGWDMRAIFSSLLKNRLTHLRN